MSEYQEVREVPHGKHKGRMLWEVVREDPNYALYAHATFSWFPKLENDQIKDCQSRYKYRSALRDWSTYDMADYGEDWA